MNEHPTSPVWLKTPYEKITSLRGDLAKTQNILDNVEVCLRQLKAKNKFNLALIAQIQEEYELNESLNQRNNK